MEPVEAQPPFPDKTTRDKTTRAKLYKRMDEQDKMLREIRTALVGDEFGNTGMAGRVAVLEAEQANQKDRVEKHDRKLWLVTAVGGAIWTLILTFKEKLWPS